MCPMRKPPHRARISWLGRLLEADCPIIDRERRIEYLRVVSSLSRGFGAARNAVVRGILSV